MHHADELNLLEDTLRLCRSLGADAADAVLFASSDLGVSYRLGKPEDVERAESTGVGIRVFVGQKVASASTSDLRADALRTACEQAIAMARATLEDPHACLADEVLWATQLPELDLCDAAEPGIEWMREQCAAAETVGMEQAGITNSQGASMHSSRHRIALATSKGFATQYETSSSSLSLTLIAGSGDKMERDYDYCLARHMADIKPAEAIGRMAAERTLARLNPKKVSTQTVPVVFDPRVARSLVGTFCGAISGASIARGTSFLKSKLNEAVFAPGITVVDEPHRVRGLGSKPCDAEGVANRTRELVSAGVLNSWLLDLRSAHQLGLQTTGHAVRGLNGSPSPSSTNCYIQAGGVSKGALIGDIKSGFYVTDTFGMGINTITGDYSQGASGMWIENGELTYAVSELTIAAHMLDMFKGLSAADDLVFEYATNAPTLRVDAMTVAGV